jgi:hypothetical protein
VRLHFNVVGGDEPTVPVKLSPEPIRVRAVVDDLGKTSASSLGYSNERLWTYSQSLPSPEAQLVRTGSNKVEPRHSLHAKRRSLAGSV